MNGNVRDHTKIPPGCARQTPDSSVLSTPHVYAPIYVAMEDLEETVQRYAMALSADVTARIPMPEIGVCIVTLDGLAIIGRTAQARATDSGVDRIFMVADLDAAGRRIAAAGLEVVVPPTAIPPGRLMHVTGPDGSLNEWLEYRPLPGESPSPVT